MNNEALRKSTANRIESTLGGDAAIYLGPEGRRPLRNNSRSWICSIEPEQSRRAGFLFFMETPVSGFIKDYASPANIVQVRDRLSAFLGTP